MTLTVDLEPPISPRQGQPDDEAGPSIRGGHLNPGTPDGTSGGVEGLRLDGVGLRALAEDTAISEVMSRSVVCLAPEAEILAVTEMFLDRDLSSAPVVDVRFKPLGMVSKTDLLRVLSERGMAAPSAAQSGQSRADADLGFGRAGDLRSGQVLTLHEDAPVSVAAAMMANENLHRLPIVSSTGEVVGVLSTLDVVRWLAQSTQMDVTDAADVAKTDASSS